MSQAVSLEANPLAQLYPDLPEYEIRPEKTALVVVDMQYADAHPDWGLGKRAKELGLEEHLRPYFQRVHRITQRILELRDAMRESGGAVIYLALSSAREDRRDVCRRHYILGLTPAAGTVEAELLDELEPGPNEILVHKTSSSPFNSTNIGHILHNLGVDTLLVTGVVTNGCVEGTVRDAADRDFNVILVEDACAALTEELHRASVRNVQRTFANVRPTAQVVAELRGVSHRTR
jgi:nicotinamidase-related amidase